MRQIREAGLKQSSFEYVYAQSLEDVFAILNKHGDEAEILAGGQSLIPL
jgi:CO/xanthine dehydrogenase FAD-binding subunit